MLITDLETKQVISRMICTGMSSHGKIFYTWTCSFKMLPLGPSHHVVKEVQVILLDTEEDATLCVKNGPSQGPH